MRNIFLLLVLFISATSFSADLAGAEEFIVEDKPQVKAKNLSRSKLKEELGDAAKQLFSETIALVKRLGLCLQNLVPVKKLPTKANRLVVTIPAETLQALGAMHEYVAYLQKTCGNLAEGLLDDEPHLGKASKMALNTSLQTMRDALDAVKKCQGNEARKRVLGVQEQVKTLSCIVDRMRNDACLRHT